VIIDKPRDTKRLEAWEAKKRDMILAAARHFAQEGQGVDDCIVWLKREYSFNPDRTLVRNYLFAEHQRIREREEAKRRLEALDG